MAVPSAKASQQWTTVTEVLRHHQMCLLTQEVGTPKADRRPRVPEIMNGRGLQMPQSSSDFQIGMVFEEDCVSGMAARISDGSVDLVVADPPYFKTIAETWDYQWRTESDYLEWSESWISETSRSLRLGGTAYVFGYFRMLARMLPLLEQSGLKLRQQIVVDKGIKAVSGRATRGYRMFPNVTESILFLFKDPIPYARELLKSRQKELGIPAKVINERLGVKSNGGGMWSIYTGRNICEQLPTKEVWDRLQDILEFQYAYEKLQITFNPIQGLTDVWTDVDFYAEKGKRIHPTQKPLPLIERLVCVSSNAGNLVMDPFSGSGTTAVACEKLARDWLAFELDQDYVAKSRVRIASARNAEGGSYSQIALSAGTA